MVVSGSPDYKWYINGMSNLPIWGIKNATYRSHLLGEPFQQPLIQGSTGGRGIHLGGETDPSRDPKNTGGTSSFQTFRSSIILPSRMVGLVYLHDILRCFS